MKDQNAPLQGLKILDFSTLLPGPYATMLLADMGADVLRVESPTRPDMLRSFPPMVDTKHPLSAAHATINRNKKSLALDLKKPEAREVIRRLLGKYDIVIEQFRPGVMDRLGFGYESLQIIRPDIIYCSITGYGQTGPLKQRAGHDINYLARCGLASYSGRSKSGPSLSGMQIADIAGGSHHAVMAILAAVYKRQQTNSGTYIDISMTDCAFALNAISGANALTESCDPKLEMELLNGGSFYDYYQTADDRHLAVGSLEPQFAEAFFVGIGHPEWEDRIFDETQQNQLKQDIANIIIQRELIEWIRVFEKSDACVEPVLSFNEAAESSLMQERKMLSVALTANGNRVKQINTPFHFGNEKSQQHIAGADLGEHSEGILLSLGFTQDEVKQICAQSTSC
ncbi:CaiB/BaiF CoA-transferase family protein [Microbulbifer sp. MLAF003]|uniref:CaiB/BaiF CoA transferase family protein n=1 Tax=unclassified Microbulbifer TaxID=2619833 RepID=UPI0024ADDAE5|nr:CaiB/BaiF CoA-transferase family protein [Microbulbifer sp. MLAF003]WHI51583.1 CaiB/BaiF CoA-transferase family protein [Microbulbifer sp. MLAF003]